MARRIRIVVGEGRTAQQGLLRFVLEGEGFDVVGEVRSTADLAIAIAEDRPDVVVLDDGIGVTAVSMVHEVVPRTKIVLVWPSAVVPIGGDARVEPAKILNDLGPAVRQVAPVGVGAGLTESFDRPEWIDRVRKDPAALRDKLTGKETTKRPSVTQLQRRGARLHPAGARKPRSAEPADREGEPAAVVALPVGGEGADAGAEAPAAEPVEERSEWNRRLGTLALSGAAAVSALVLAVALGGGPVTPEILRGGGFPPVGSGFVAERPQVGPFSDGTLGGDGYSPVPRPPEEPTESDEPTESPDTGGGDVLAPTGGTDEPTTEPPVDGGKGPSGDGGNGPSGNGGNGPSGNGGNGPSGNGGNGGADLAMPGQAAAHNPFGGPPSKLGLTPAQGAGLGVTAGRAADHGGQGANAHAHKH